MTENRGTGINYCDTEEEYEDKINELSDNPDFIFLGYFDSIQSIYEDLDYQGITEEEAQQMSHNRYGACLEILEYASDYCAFIGIR